ncbi:MAG TPA: DMT family transporter [Planctomycetaceae bacterium]|nr:DMT family transporter [Planctomycetaceae bacterium]
MVEPSDSDSSSIRPRLLLLAAALLWSTSGLFVKSPPLERLPLDDRGPVLACFRALFAAAVLLPFVRRTHVRWRPMLIPTALSFAVMNLLFVIAMTRTTAAAAIFLQYTATVWAAVAGAVWLRERIDRGSLVALACAVAGIAWIVAAESRAEHVTGNLIALGSGAAYAGVVIGLRVLRTEAAAWLVALNHAVAGLVLLPWVLSRGVSLDAGQWALVALLGVVQMGVPYILFARAVRSVTAREAALLVLLEPVLNPFWVWLVWGETPPASTLAGGALIVGGLALRYTLLRPRAVRSD